MKIWLQHDQASLDAAYDQRVWAPDMADWLARYRADTEAARAALRPAVLSYGPHGCDLYPAQGRPRGVLLHIHGGAWRAQSRADSGILAPAFCAAGFEVAVPDFSLLPARRLPDVVQELRDCVAWLRPRGPIHLSGHSSGAHLAAVLATEQDFASVTLVSGLYDLEPVLLSSRRDYVMLDAAEAAALSPLRHAARITAPVFLAWGTAESPEFIRQSAALAAALPQAACFVLPGVNHFAAAYAPAQGAMHEAVVAAA
ncbi:alpha/beta hydrolase [Falsiroseomonas selenitidurans]|uniref:Alpha/beta hydrolase fold domain-containing protein n=1 Tax=Falsiroseomonas selenitidurans TaxID=2716335 RepID=A0ABX1EAP4_9PROT|nr:alpha/beta hydrolase [Falsiroseomonas selenitidurans]NKC32862.1 alpha/beta hydrolase fold domain-containing protein [Falsiroseomonas selenitidurans]